MEARIKIGENGIELTTAQAEAITNIDAVLALNDLDWQSTSVDLIAFIYFEIAPDYNSDLFWQYFTKLSASANPRHRQIAISEASRLLQLFPENRPWVLNTWVNLMNDADKDVAMRALDVLGETIPDDEERLGIKLLDDDERVMLNSFADSAWEQLRREET